MSEQEILIACVEPNSLSLFVQKQPSNLFMTKRASPDGRSAYHVTENVSVNSETTRVNIESALKATAKQNIRAQREGTLKLIDSPGAEVK